MRPLARACAGILGCLAAVACAQAETRVAPAQSAAAPAPAPHVDAKTVEALLRADTADADWLALGPAAVTPLAQVISEPGHGLEQRRAAVRALAVLATPEAIEAIRGVVQDPQAPEPLRVEAAAALARAGGQASVAELLPLVASGSDALCAAAAEALANLGGAEVREALESRLERELDPELRARLQRSLTRLNP